MDKKLLSQIANLNPTAKAMFKHFRTRDRNPKDGVLDIRRTKYAIRNEGVEVVPEDFVANFKAMEKAGLGKLIIVKGKPVRFKWAVNMKETAGNVTGIDSSSVLHTQPPQKTVSAPNNVQGGSDLAVLLGPGRKAQFSLPSNLTQEEADFICSLLLDKVC